MMQHLADRLQELSEKLRLVPVFRWAVVVNASPLTVQLDADDAPLVGTPSTLVAHLRVGDRVLVMLLHNRVTVVGRGKGAPHNPATPFAMDVGFVGAAPLPAGGDELVTVAFQAGRFSGTPRVFATPMGGANLRDVNVTAVSATTSQAVFRKGSNSPVARSFGFTWQAIQMTG